MAERAPVRTLKLSRPLHEADREIAELEFLEPTASLYDDLERTQEWNAHAKKRSQIVASGLVLLEHLTGLHSSTLASMSFGDRKRTNEIAAEIMGEEMGEELEGNA